MCATTSGIVFLDLQRNRYQAISAHHEIALQAIQERPLEECPDEAHALARTLERAGLVESTSASVSVSHAASRACIARISANEVIEAQTRPPTHGLAFMRSYMWAKHSIKRATLFTVVEQLTYERSSSAEARSRADDACAASLHALGFHRLRPFAFTAREHCLLHALALVRYLSFHGIDATWFIGVNTQPWRAHSWVQYEDIVLDATPEQVLEYTPILVV